MDINFSKEDLAFRDELRDWLANDYPKHVKDKMDKGEHLTRQDMVDYHKAVCKRLDGLQLASRVWWNRLDCYAAIFI